MPLVLHSRRRTLLLEVNMNHDLAVLPPLSPFITGFLPVNHNLKHRQIEYRRSMCYHRMAQYICAPRYKDLQVARGNRYLSIISCLHHPLGPLVQRREAPGMVDKARLAVNPAKPVYKEIPDGIAIYQILRRLQLQRKDIPTTTLKV
jgi:hypothetical protein